MAEDVLDVSVGTSPENPSPRAGGEGQVSALLTSSINESAAVERGCTSERSSASTRLRSFSAH